MKKLKKGQKFILQGTVYELLEPCRGYRHWKCRFNGDGLEGIYYMPTQVIIAIVNSGNGEHLALRNSSAA
jgi:hypothetical protein